MGRHLAAEQARRVDDGLHLIVEQLLVQPAGDVAVHPAGRRELDHVGALGNLPAGGATAVVGAVAGVGGAGSPQLLDVAVHVVGGIGVAARPGDPEAGRDDCRPGNQAGRDAIPQRRHAVDVGAEVAHGREAGLDRPARVVDANQQVVLDVAVEDLEPGPHLVVVVEHVHVRIDQAGQDELALEVDQPGAVGRGDMTVTNGFDAPAADDDRRRPAGRLAGTIEERARVDDGAGSAAVCANTALLDVETEGWSRGFAAQGHVGFLNSRSRVPRRG